MTPEEKLCSRTWRMRNSAGILWCILSMGLLTGVGFLIRGVQAKNKTWIGMGVGLLVLGIGLMAATSTFDSGTKEHPIHSVASDIWGWTYFLTFAGGLTATLVTNRKWLLWKAHSSDVKWYAKGGASQPLVNASPARGYDPNIVAATALTTTRSSGSFPIQAPTVLSPAAPGLFATPAPGGKLDVNSASAQHLQAALGVDATTANRIIETRQAIGSFSSFEQLMSKAQVPPHLLIPHRATLTFGTPAGGHTPRQSGTPSGGAQSGRRLFD
jgi:DNA uptake protein ComE-like DNA-binding protein